MQTVTLTDREREALVLLGEGLTIAKVGAAMGITQRTAKAYADRLRSKFGVGTARELIPLARDYQSNGPATPSEQGTGSRAATKGA